MSDNDLVERVARAIAFGAGTLFAGAGRTIAAYEFGWKDDGEHKRQYAEAHWKEHEYTARAAIEAMREPTPVMLAAAENDHYIQSGLDDCNKHGIPLLAWRIMIDAALEKDKANVG